MIEPKQIQKDIMASLVVFLVAIPLCLGIALASNASLFAGILTGCIGGIVVGLFSASNVSVSGPAAGMVAVVLSAVAALGSYDKFLLALLIAGFIQVLSGWLKAGFIANYVPTHVIKGLLAAIGILIIIKQIPLAIGYVTPNTEAIEALKTAEEGIDLPYTLYFFSHIHPSALFITLASLFILYGWDKLNHPFFKTLPAAFAVVLFGIGSNTLFHSFYPSWALQPFHLVNVPQINSIKDFMGTLQHPDFSALRHLPVYLYAIMIAVIASLETLLNFEAIEKLDKRHRYYSRDRELVAQGVGNMISGLLGGLPITSVIVRSSVNIQAGAKTKFSTIFHGLLLLFSLTFFSKALNTIPTASLAAILMFTGYKLANYHLFKSMYAQGFRYFIPFLITLVAIVATNLLMGILIGLGVSIFFILWHNSKRSFTIVEEQHTAGTVRRVILPQQVTFLDRAGIIDGFNRLMPHSKVIVDANNTDYIDEDILTIMQEYKDILHQEKRILFNFEGFQEHYDLAKTKHFLQVTTYDVQSNLNPQEVLSLLKEGNQRFMNNTPIHSNYKQQIAATAQSQHPVAVILSCIDSRVPVEIVFNLNLGDVFVIRIAGNIVNNDILASIEFASKLAGAKLVVVLGHQRCGAIQAACKAVDVGHLGELLHKIQPAIEQTLAESHCSLAEGIENPQFLEQVTWHNIEETQKSLLEKSPIIRELVKTGQVGLVGAYYNITNGEVIFDHLKMG